MTVSDVEGEVLAILLMGSETIELLSDMFVEDDQAILRQLGGGDLTAGLRRTLQGLERRGFVTSRDGWWTLTDTGAEVGRAHDLSTGGPHP